MYRFLCVVAALAATPVQAGWELRQTPGLAVMEQSVGNLTVSFQCMSRFKDRLEVFFAPRSGAMPEYRSVMLWIVMPDGRMARHAMDATPEGPGLSAMLATSDLVLQQLRQASALEFTHSGKAIVKTDAKGTGAFRLAVLEQCGF